LIEVFKIFTEVENVNVSTNLRYLMHTLHNIYIYIYMK